MTETTRAYQEAEPPSSTYVPGSGVPHPGRSRTKGETPPTPPIAGDAWGDSPAYLRGVDLFNAGFYWEAHEAWEALWHAHGRRGPVALLLKGLIKMAAAGVKVRQGRPAGVRSHAARAAGHFTAVRAEVGPSLLGLDLDGWIDFARSVAGRPPETPDAPGGSAVVVFTRRLTPGGDSPASGATRPPAAGP
ncbi:DUF309 domain-containing protein [Paludisphaera mucosa]|uniref:DUF309 domain-containing protein n=1 Tax=Paludisphaera mucosa TaxID=3030827 RepID=A0ABT6F533_9BACT|nr:DUF309 domain-containing protein [Paludisphaera mucosa]MDG3002690.1 DUF309 domain-containing protein [Paludisphaera mucosa]